MSEPFLILHKVRGEPTFDIAIRLLIGDEEGWIVPTSGHRAYPYDQWSLASLPTNPFYFRDWNRTIPDAWPDHYSSNDRPIREATYNVHARAAGLLAKLGLVSKVERRD